MSTKSSLVVVRNGFEPDYRSDDYGLDCSAGGCTKQSFKDECDVNNIVNRWLRSGVAPASSQVAQFLDVSNVPDYHGALNIVRAAQGAFGALPSAVRDRFENDPALLLAFLDDEKNYDEALSLGLVAPREPSTGEQERSIAGVGSPVGGSPTSDLSTPVSGSVTAPSGG